MLNILQELMAAELDTSLGYEKNQKADSATNKQVQWTLHKKEPVLEIQLATPRDFNDELEPKLFPKYQRDISGIKDKVIFSDSKLFFFIRRNIPVNITLRFP